MRKQGVVFGQKMTAGTRKIPIRAKWPYCFLMRGNTAITLPNKSNSGCTEHAVMVPMGQWAEKRLKNLTKNDHIRDESRSKSGFGKKVVNWIGRYTVYPTNVLHLATKVTNKKHSAVFPIELPTWFIRLFTEEGDIVLGPFIG